MVVACPKCKSRLKVPDEKIKPEGTRIKCPKCATVLLIKKPVVPVKEPAAPKREPVAPRPKVEAPSIQKKEPVAPPKVEAPPLQRKEPMAPVAPPAKVLLAHAEAGALERLRSVLSDGGFEVLSASDGKTAIVKAIKGKPSIALLDVALPVFSGYQISRYMKTKAETKDIKTFLIASATDEKRRRKGPASAYGAVDYMNEAIAGDAVLSLLAGAPLMETPLPVIEPSVPRKEPVAPLKVEEATIIQRKEPVAPAAPMAPQPKVEAPSIQRKEPMAPSFIEPPVFKEPVFEKPLPQPATIEPPSIPRREPLAPPKVEEATTIQRKEPVAPAAPTDPQVERARRLVRAILSDLDLYSPKKVEEAIRVGKFKEAFEKELKEGVKHYESRIPAEIRSKRDFFGEELDIFLEKKRKALGA